jgi:hypothetical protein
MEPAKGLLQLNFYQNNHIRLERWEGQTCYYSEEVDRSAFSSPSFMKLPAHPVRTGQARRGLPGDVILFYIVPLYPAYPARAGRGTLPVKDWAA